MAALSVSEAVGDAAQAAVLALSLTRPSAGEPATTVVPVLKRKTPSVPEGDRKGLPQVVVTVGEEGKTEYLTATQKLKTYPVAVTIVTGGGEKAADDPQVRQWRERVEKELEKRTTWAGVTGWNQIEITNKAPFDPQALSKAFNYSTIVAEVEVIEDRS